MTPESQKSNAVLIAVAIIGIIGTIVATTIGVIGNYNIEKLRQETELTRIALTSNTIHVDVTQISPTIPILTPHSEPISITIPANIEWVETGVYLKSGQILEIFASGTVNTLAGSTGRDTSPEGDPYICRESDCYMMGATYGTLIGKIGANSLSFRVGSKLTMTASTEGKLYLMVNDNIGISRISDNLGSFNANITLK